MANISTRELLAAPVVTRIVRTLAFPTQRFQDFFNLGPESPVIENRGGHDASWDVFNNTRAPANMRAPGTGPSTRSTQPVGYVSARIPRFHEKVKLLDEGIFRLRRLGSTDVDVTGQQYVTNQQRILAQRFRNSREFLCRCILKGGMGVSLSGEDWVPVEKGSGDFDVDFQVPAGNKTQLNMLGAGNIIDTLWSTLSADIPTQCSKINEAHSVLHGRPLSHAWIRSQDFNAYVLKNTVIQAQGGSANNVWLSWERSTYTDPVNGQKDAGFKVVLRAIPWLTWHLYDGVLDINGTTTSLITAGHVHFLPEPDNTWVGGFNGSEMVRETSVSAADERFGMQAWTEPCTQPSGFELIGLDNFMPALFVPSCVTDATIV